LDINERRLYRATHSTFQEYCADKWNMTAARAYQLCDAAEVMKSLPPGTSTIVDNEAKARELAKIPSEKRVEVLNRVETKAKATRKKATAKDIREAAGTEDPAVIQRSKYPPGRNKVRVAKEWWYHRASAKGRGEFLERWIFMSRKPVVVPSKAELRKAIDRWMDDAVKEAAK
jgi:hypothetical protein